MSCVPSPPSVLREAMGEWFEVADDVPFVMKVYPVRPGKRDRVPAVIHVDGTGRCQSVTREARAGPGAVGRAKGRVPRRGRSQGTPRGV